MKDKLFIIGKLLSALIFIAILSLMGMGTGKPIMTLAYAGFFLVVTLVIYQIVRKNQRHFEIISQGSNLVNKIAGAVLVVVGVLAPAFAINNVSIFDLGATKAGFGLFAIVLGITLVMMAGMIFGIYMINEAKNNKMKKVLGYLVIIILSAVPAICVMPFDRTTTGIGSTYYLAFIVTILTWWGFSLYLNNE